MQLRALGLLLAFGLTASLAWADGWHRVGSFTADGEVKSASVRRNCSEVMIRPSEGSVEIGAIVVERKGKSETLRVGTTLSKGQSKEVDLGERAVVQTLKIEDKGSGRYDVFVK